MRLLLSNALHAAAHRLTPRQWPCECESRAFMRGIKFRRDQEMRELSLPSTPDDLDAWFRRVIADSERPAA